ncbi:MAG: BamA/TamA family outer membrane protein [Oscillatoria princeps RMCB-10]|nr:BamA/TamA family outer membrane protein [Oscillatoria princeps RMCB-10]
MEVENNVNKMRIPTVWVAILTASATLSLSNPVSGQTVSLQSAPEPTGSPPAQPLPPVPVENAEKASDSHLATGFAEPQMAADSQQVALPAPNPTAVWSLESPVGTPLKEGQGEDMAAVGPENPAVAEIAGTAADSPASPAEPFPAAGGGVGVAPAAVWALESVAQTPQPPVPVPVPASPPPATPPGAQCPDPAAPQVLVAEVAVSGAQGELQDEIYRTIRTQPGRTANRCQLQEDVNAIFATGFFGKVDYVPEDTPIGVRVTFVVQPNPVLEKVVVSAVPEGAAQQAVPQTVVDSLFRDQYGRILNLRTFQESVKKLNQWYKDNGYILAQVIDSSAVTPDGKVTLLVAEGVIEDVQIRFATKEGETADEQGNPIRGRTRKFIITREMALKPGEVLKESTLISDLRRIYGLGLFEKVEPTLNPGADPRRVVVVLNVTERNTGSVAAGAGISSATGVFGTISYQEQNLGGNNHKLGTQLQVGERALLFDVNFTDPWIAGDPYRTSYTVNGFRRRSISLIYTGGSDDIRLPDPDNPLDPSSGDRPRVLRLGGGVTFTRPLNPNPLEKSEWTASLGLQYQRISIRDSDGDISPNDALGNDLSFSGEGKDDLTALQFGLSRDRRDSALKPTSGSLLRLSTEQSVPVGLGSIFMNRLRASYSYYMPVKYFNFSKGPQTLAFNVQTGTVLGDLPPYEAFALGGSNSVRGYDEGEVGSGRSFLQATAEYRFPIFSVIGGALFVDFGSDLGSGSGVPGDPAGVRGKPGTGFGYGLGVRIDSPLGPIRVDFGINDDGESLFHFGLGERF